jgi:phenylacetate-CoA ligase
VAWSASRAGEDCTSSGNSCGGDRPEPASGAADGQRWELVFTTLTKEAFPLIRTAQGHLALMREGVPMRSMEEKKKREKLCRKKDDKIMRRLPHGGISGRSDPHTTTPPPTPPPHKAIKDLQPPPPLHAYPSREVSAGYLEIQVEVSERIFSDEIRKLQTMELRIAKDIKDTSEYPQK